MSALECRLATLRQPHPNELAGLIGDQLSAQDSAMLQSPMDTGDPGQERMRFLG